MQDPTAMVEALPAASSKRLAMRVTADAERQIRAGHPWLFDDSIVHLGHDGAAAGDLAVIFDRDRKFLAIGLYDPASPIRVRVLHRGRATPIDDEWFDGRIVAAIARRSTLAADPDSDAYRLVHGENDGLPGLVVDRYRDRLVVEIFTAAWFPHLKPVLASLRQRCAPAQIVLRLGGIVRRGETHGLADGDVLVGADDARVIFRENGLMFEADLARGQKTGHFLDQRDNRAEVRSRATGAGVLDVFSCTGGFSVHAAAGGAVSVESIDQSAPALAAAAANMGRNSGIDAVARCRHRTSCGDAFEIMADHAGKGRRFDLVVVDPPSFTRRESQVPAALAAYRRLAALAVELVGPDGTLVQASCSARVAESTLVGIVESAVRDAGRRVRSSVVTGHGIDHPIGFPQGAYLKAVFVGL